MNKRILIIEDVEDNRELLVQYFEDVYEILEAVDGRAGLDQAAATEPDLILLDLSLPELDGWQVARQLKASNHTRSIPIIAVSAHAMVGDREKALAAGCDAYVAKPIDFTELQQLTEHFLGGTDG